MSAKLTIVQGEHVGRVHDIGDAEAPILGRSSKSDICVPDARASRNHCVIQLSGNLWAVTDMNSLNGTFVNNKRVARADLANGDLIRIGSTTYKFTLCGQSPFEPPPEYNDQGRSELTEAELIDLGFGPEPNAEEAPPEPPPAEPEMLACSQCGRKLPQDALANGTATEIGGRLFCSRCVVSHPESKSADVRVNAPDSGDSSEFSSLLRSLQKATEADRIDNGNPSSPQEPEPLPKKPALLDRLRRKPPKE